jgi:hypothetical protein
MRQLNILVLLLILSISCKEKSTPKSTAGMQETAESKMTNTVTKTDRHVKIPNSHLYIIPPAGFMVNENMGKLGKGENYAHFGMLKIFSGTTPEKYFSELKAQEDKDFPGSWKQEDIIADGHKATLYQYKNAAVFQHYLAFKDGYTDEMIIANFEESEAVTGMEMYEALKTVVVEK